MTVGPYALLGAKLVELGYAAIPIMPGTKRPGYKKGGSWAGLMDWRERWANRLPTSFEITAWSATEAGICVVCGSASGGLVAIDIDSDVPEVISAILAVIPPSNVRKRGKKGVTLFYYGPTIEKSRSFHPFVDVIGPGRQTVLPCTVHPDTKEPYQWTTTDTLEHFRPSELPEITPAHIDALGEVLEQFGFSNSPAAEKISATVDSAHKPHRQLNQHALDHLDMWVPLLGLERLKRTREGFEAVAHWRPSTTGQPIEKRKLNLKISRNGIRDFGADRNYTALDLWQEAANCDLGVAFRGLVDATGWLGDFITVKAVNGRSLVPAYAGPIVDVGNDPERAPEAGIPGSDGGMIPSGITDDAPVFDESMTYPGGLVEEIIDWIDSTARQPSRIMALGAAVTIVGTLIGRRAAGPTASATHLYAVTLAKSGAGKDHALKCINRLLEAAGAKHHIGASEFISMPAVLNFVKRMPLSLCPQDEFGAFLKRVLNVKKSSNFEQGISKVLRSMWSTSFQAVPMPEWAGRPSEVIYTPAMSICGASTPDEFFESLAGADIKNGFLNRFLVISNPADPIEQEPDPTRRGVPDGLKAKLADLYRFGNPLGIARLGDSTLDARPEILEWADDKAKDAFKAYQEAVRARMRSDPQAEPFLARAAEIAIRLATIAAAGRDGPNALVTAAQVEWGRRIAEASSALLIDGAARHMSENEQQAKHKLVLGVIEKAGAITRAGIARALEGRLKTSERDSILADLEEAGRIVREQEQTRGRPRVVFVSERAHERSRVNLSLSMPNASLTIPEGASAETGSPE